MESNNEPGWIKKQNDIELRKWCVDQWHGQAILSNVDTAFAWLIDGYDEKDIDLRKYAYNNCYKIKDTSRDRDRLVCAKEFYEWLLGNKF